MPIMNPITLSAKSRRNLYLSTREQIEKDNPTLAAKLRAQAGTNAYKETLREAHEIDPKLYMVFRRLLSVFRLNDSDYTQYW